ncbi:hypothetical protein MAPG_06107 [Magnaporthiopsis poae ATCC 64411]|uniref:Uncharacterized protein n=1 Tax=Magnaporthiopsis poae (strain ATCC 64411 / 73-15) TaxID=644358 RepID=A0A0C4E158_MAGP6|nr:hypothetical protein MAPG_06107 [Magnaporthiopsis poae ATCC 64411]
MYMGAALPVSGICEGKGDPNALSVKFWCRADRILQGMIHSGDLAPSLDPAYIVFQAVEPSFCSTADKAKGLYDKMYEHVGKRHGVRALVMGSQDEDGFGFLEKPLNFKVLKEELTPNDKESAVHLYWREP